MKDILNFLNLIVANNNKIWFNENKDLYLKAKQEFDSLSQELIDKVAIMDKRCNNLTLKDCTWRFYRDIRFSKDKSPYKNHFGVFICPKGKKSMFSGYYFHIEPQGENYLSGSLLAIGSYNPDKDMISSLRMDIYNNGAAFEKAIAKAKGFRLWDSYQLKRLPKDIPSSKYDELIKYKTLLLRKDLDENYLFSPKLIDNIVEDFALGKEFSDLLNDAYSCSGNY